MKAKLIKSNGNVSEVEPKNGINFSLEELQQFVGGYIEIVPIKNGRFMVVNEEGKLSNLPFNLLASAEYNEIVRGDSIVGDALICPSSMIK